MCDQIKKGFGGIDIPTGSAKNAKVFDSNFKVASACFEGKKSGIALKG